MYLISRGVSRKFIGTDDGAKLRDGVVELEEAMAIEREDGDAVASFDAQRYERAGEPVDTVVEVGKSVARGSADRCDLVRAGSHGPL